MSRRRFGRWIAVLLASAVAIVAPVPMLTRRRRLPIRRRRCRRPSTRSSPRNQSISLGRLLRVELSSQCAKVTVPRDWKNPAKGTLSLAIAYLKARGTSKGLLTANPGGPGAAGSHVHRGAVLEQDQARSSTTCSASTRAATAPAPTSSA